MVAIAIGPGTSGDDVIGEVGCSQDRDVVFVPLKMGGTSAEKRERDWLTLDDDHIRRLPGNDHGSKGIGADLCGEAHRKINVGIKRVGTVDLYRQAVLAKADIGHRFIERAEPHGWIYRSGSGSGP